jgi:hypothetical protein
VGSPFPHFRILFIGNSYTSRNDMPEILAGVAAKSGISRPVETQVVAFGGASLAAHWNRGLAQELLAGQMWNAVVLQDQSTRPLHFHKSMQEYGRRFAQAAQAAGAKPFLYVTWARQDQPESQDTITSAYQELADATGAVPVPVGPAWQQLHRARPQLVLYHADRSHPTLAGSYLSACVFCASIFGKKPKGIDNKKMDETMRLTKEDADLIHQVAWRTATESAGNSMGRSEPELDP